MTERQLIITTNQGSGTASSEDTDKTAAALTNATAEINGYLGARYELPLATVPQVLVGLCCRIARYYLLSGGGSEPGPWVTDDYKEVVKQLAAIRDGKFDLGLDTEGDVVAVAAPTRARIRTSSEAPRFGRARMKGF